MTDEERAELAQHQRDWGRLRARMEYTMNRRQERFMALLRGERLPVNPVELSDAEWDDAMIELEAWDIVLSNRRKTHASRS